LPPEVERLIVDPVCPGVAKLLTVSVGCARRISKSADSEDLSQKSLSAALNATTEHVVTSDAVSLPEVMLQLGVDVVNVTAPLPEPPLVVNVIAIPTNPLFTGLLIVSGACGFKKVNAFAADVACANSAVAAFVATTEHVVFAPMVTVKEFSVMMQRALAGAIA
jgi:hypothetical protein